MRISGVEFPKPLMTALRDDTLVIFAGAGVSMGTPARLPDFEGLAEAIAAGTGEARQPSEPVDRFLGRLQSKGVDVRVRAVDVLSRLTPQPTALHRDLLRLYPTPQSIRIVTTNFDALFEQAGGQIFDSAPSVFTAPALPLGTAFSGIVHAHGSLEHPEGVVLTDADFGKAYLTEDWARRFLVDLFRSYTVLFVGYSHNDVVMSYLARALPPSGSRFALTDEPDDERWGLLGIVPVGYAAGDDHRALETSVEGLAVYKQRGVLDWQRRIRELAAVPPSLDDEAMDLIEEALSDATRCRFFTDEALDPEWITWLERHGRLDRLFGDGETDKCDRLLARWLAERFARHHPDALLRLIARMGGQQRPQLWRELLRAVTTEGETPWDAATLASWVSLLLVSVPPDVDAWDLLDLGECCAAAGLTEGLLGVFNALAESRLVLEEPGWLEDDAGPPVVAEMVQKHDHAQISQLYAERLKPVLERVAEPLLMMVIHHLTNQHDTLRLWESSSTDWDPASHGRSAIEPHEQDKYAQSTDVLIDAARDCLEHLAASQPDAAATWCDHLARARVPLLRRLAVHTMQVRGDLTPDEKADWLLSHIGLHDRATHHETFILVRAIYVGLSAPQRQALIDAILAYTWPHPEEEHSDRRTIHHHLDWLQWLHDSDPECALAEQVLDDLKGRRPDVHPSDHPDLTHYSTVSDWIPQSPWSVEELLSRPGGDRLSALLSFEGDDAFEPSRDGLRASVEEAATRDFQWGLALADSLIESASWETDLWPALIRSWSRELGEDKHRSVLAHLGSPELYAHHVRSITYMLYDLVKDGGLPYAPALLEEANRVAGDLWGHLERDDGRAAELLTVFWVAGLWLWRNRQDPIPDSINGGYSAALLRVLQDRELPGTYAKAVLARHLEFLLIADEQWTMEHMVPLFQLDGRIDENSVHQAVWHGVVAQGFQPRTIQALRNALLQAVECMSDLFPDGHGGRGDFIRRFAEMVVVDDNPLATWIPTFFLSASLEDRRSFAQSVGGLLHAVSDAVQREWWRLWLREYWENRLKGVPPPSVDDKEGTVMLGWLADVKSLFPEAVEFAVRTPFRDAPPGLLYAMKQNGIWSRYPESTGWLLVSLGNRGETPPRLGRHAAALVAELLELNLPTDLKTALSDLRAKLG